MSSPLKFKLLPAKSKVSKLHIEKSHMKKEKKNCLKISDISSINPRKQEVFLEELLPKEFLSSYLMMELIGRGNQAKIFKVQQKKDRKFFAAKVYRTIDPEEITIIEKEVKILKQLEHENIIKYHDFIKDERIGVFILIMELFSTLTVEVFIKEKLTCLSTEQRVFICKNLIETVLYLHSQKIAHKDLNPLNILIDPISLQIKLIDFGLSVLNVDNDCSPEGNFSYRPPEHIEIFQNPYNADLWCLHLILLSVCIGKKITTKKAMALGSQIDLMDDCQLVFILYYNVGLLIQEKLPDMKKLKEF